MLRIQRLVRTVPASAKTLRHCRSRAPGDSALTIASASSNRPEGGAPAACIATPGNRWTCRVSSDDNCKSICVNLRALVDCLSSQVIPELTLLYCFPPRIKKAPEGLFYARTRRVQAGAVNFSYLACNWVLLSWLSGSTRMQSTGQTSMHWGSLKWPTHSVHSVGSIS